MLATVGVLDILLLMAANLAILHGFSRTPLFFERAFLGEGAGITIVGCFIGLWVGVRYMIEIRASEERLNIQKKF